MLKVGLILYSVRQAMAQDATRLPTELDSIRVSMEAFRRFEGISWDQ